MRPHLPGVDADPLLHAHLSRKPFHTLEMSVDVTSYYRKTRWYGWLTWSLVRKVGQPYFIFLFLPLLCPLFVFRHNDRRRIGGLRGWGVRGHYSECLHPSSRTAHSPYQMPCHHSVLCFRVPDYSRQNIQAHIT